MSNMPGDCGNTHPDGKDTHHHMHPHVGMRKVKSILAIFCGFCLWQLIRLFVPGLEVHPIFIYIYGMMEIRETSEKTKENGKMRIFGYVDRRWRGTPYHVLDRLALGAVAGASLPALGGGGYSAGGKPACPMRGRITGMPCVLRAGNCNLYRFDRQPF